MSSLKKRGNSLLSWLLSLKRHVEISADAYKLVGVRRNKYITCDMWEIYSVEHICN